MTGVQQVTVAAGEADMRLDRWFKARFPDLSHGQLQKLLRTGQIRVDGGRVKASSRVSPGQIVRVPPLPAFSSVPHDGAAFGGQNLSPRMPHQSRKEAGRLSEADQAFIEALVVHCDDEVIALAKPAGLAVQGGSGNPRHIDGLLDGLRFGASERPRLVHRLDKDTSGVLLLARTRIAAGWLGKALQDRAAEKLYWALTVGVPRPTEGRIDAPLIKRGGVGDERMRVAEPGEDGAQKAITDYVVVERAGQALAWLALQPLTGRTHQLRAHVAAMGFPIVGDGKYGGAEAHPGGELPRKLHLHARAIRLRRPNGRWLSVDVPIDGHMLETWRLLGFDPGTPPAQLSFAEARR